MLAGPVKASNLTLKTLLKSRTNLDIANNVPRCVHNLVTEIFIFNIKRLPNTIKLIYRYLAGV
jgi:hypothetical protein